MAYLLCVILENPSKAFIYTTHSQLKLTLYMINEIFRIEDQHGLRERLLRLFSNIMKKLKPKQDMENLNNFDIPFNVVVEKMLDFMGNLPEGDKKH